MKKLIILVAAPLALVAGCSSGEQADTAADEMTNTTTEMPADETMGTGAGTTGTTGATGATDTMGTTGATGTTGTTGATGTTGSGSTTGTGTGTGAGAGSTTDDTTTPPRK